jgi:putative PIG3 family NAD(P)H quinone oxidoreductase
MEECMSLPETMTAIAIREPGGPDVLVPVTRPLPQPGPHEILIKVSAAGVNRPDVSQRAGKYPPPKDASDLPGLEVAGEVVALGEGVTMWKLGDKVCSLCHGGGYAEYCTVHESHAMPLPKSLTAVEAAALPETFFTVWSNVFDRAGLQAGEWMLVHGGSSGIGTTAIMLGKAFGAKVIVTAGSEEKCEACRKLGADVAINYNEQDFVDVVMKVTNGHGADVILDMVGGPYVERNHKCAAMDGRVAQIAFMQGTKADLRYMSARRITHFAQALRPRTVAQKGAIAAKLREHVWPLIEAGKIKPVIDSTFKLTEAPKAHARLESSQHIGKVVMVV